MRLIVIAIAMALAAPSAVMAKRAVPKAVAPVVANSIEYSAPTDSMGVVVARDVVSHKELWRERIYTIQYNPSIETDVQDIYITSLSIEGRRLIVATERGGKFSLDLVTRKVANDSRH